MYAHAQTSGDITIELHRLCEIGNLTIVSSKFHYFNVQDVSI